MIILDTNVLSELMKPKPDRRVVRWVDSQPAASLFTTSITQAEILHGAMLLPKGKRRTSIDDAVTSMFEEDFAGRVLAFDSEAAFPYARIASERRRAGRPISQLDAQIAAIAESRGASVATRNVADFDGCGVGVIDPWIG
jgi:predicted nucleic acid-binding protein